MNRYGIRALAIVLLFAVSGGTGAYAAGASSEAQIEEAIQEVIAQRHPQEGGDWWRGLGPRTPRIIERLYGSTTDTYKRLRLLQALAWFDDPETLAFLRQQAEKTDDDMTRLSAIRALSVSQGAKETELFARFLKHPDPQTRLAAAEALKGLDDPRARAEYRRFLKEEKAPWLVARLNDQLPGAPQAAPRAEQPDPGFSGVWKGYWVAPRADSPGMESVAAVVRFEKGTESGQLRGTVERSALRKRAKQVYALALAGTKNKLKGTLKSVAPASERTPGTEVAPVLSVEAELVQRGSFTLMELRVPEFGGLLLLRRELRE